jgi:quinol monooxygenase YgiN
MIYMRAGINFDAQVGTNDSTKRFNEEKGNLPGGKEMELQSRLNSMRRPLLRMGAVLMLAACGLAGRVLAQEPSGHDRIYVVAHVDIIPPETAAGTKLVQQYVIDTRKDEGIVRVEAGAEISRVNHISIVEVWQNQKAYDGHISAAHTRQFRQQIDPKLGSPYDERLHHSLE